MNTTALKFLKWIYSKHYYDKCGEDEKMERAKEQARENWEEFGEEVIKKALNHSGCVSYQSFRQIAKYLKNKI